MEIRIDITGFNEVISDLGKVGVAGQDAVYATIVKLVTETKKEAQKGIRGGPKTGRTYRRRGVSHTASAPGQYPASDTGVLLSSVSMVLPVKGAKMTGRVGTRVEYGKYLEFGTSRMAARPWLMPSFLKAKRTTLAALRAEFNRRTAGL